MEFILNIADVEDEEGYWLEVDYLASTMFQPSGMVFVRSNGEETSALDVLDNMVGGMAEEGLPLLSIIIPKIRLQRRKLRLLSWIDLLFVMNCTSSVEEVGCQLELFFCSIARNTRWLKKEAPEFLSWAIRWHATFRGVSDIFEENTSE
jgi:hypothetical protein